MTTHLVPAAFPRTYPHAPVPSTPPPLNETPAQRKARVTRAARDVINTRAMYELGQLGMSGSTAPLWCAINRYVRRNISVPNRKGSRGLTLFFAHASSFPKEIWEPLIHHYIRLCEADPSAPRVDEIWSFEAVQHGDSALVNANNLCGIWDASDGARDMLHFLSFYLPDTISREALPTHLTRLPDSVADARLLNGFAERTIVSIGHSLGGSCLTLAATTQPSLFSSLVVIDPFICAPYTDAEPVITAFVHGALARRTEWSSRTEARSAFLSTPFFRAWHPAMLDIYLNTALYHPDPSSERVALKTPGVQEAILYESRIPIELWQMVETLDERVAVRWIMPSGKSVFGGDPSMAQSLVWRRPANSSNIIIQASHMIPQERPFEVAADLFDFIKQKYSSTPRAKL